MEVSLACKLCIEPYCEVIRPRVLQCGHCYCSVCVEKLIKYGKISCPTCKREYHISISSCLPINYDLEHCISNFKMLGVCKPNKSKLSRIKITQELVARHTSSAKELLSFAEDVERQLVSYSKSLFDYRQYHEKLREKLHEILNWNDGINRKIKEETQKIDKMQSEIGNCRKAFAEILPNIPDEVHEMPKENVADTLAQVFVTIADLENTIEKSRREFPDHEIIASLKKLKALEVLDAIEFHCYEDVRFNATLLNDQLTIPEKFTASQEEIIIIPVDAIKRKPNYWKSIIACSKVFAVDSDSKCQRFADLSFSDGKIYLHHLKDKVVPPPFAYGIKYSEAISCLNKDITVAFMDLQWDGTLKGRVHISLSPDTPLAQHFRILCTGERGPTYAQTKFFKVCNFGYETENIVGGDYVHNNGTGGAAVIEGMSLTDSVYNQYYGEGSLRACTDTNLAQFSIKTRCSRYSSSKGVFGVVTDGMNVIKDAAKRLQDVSDVQIVDCGIVLPL